MIMNMAQTTQVHPPNSLPRPADACWCGSGNKYKKCHRDADTEFLKAEKKRLFETRVQPGTISPMRTVPANIGRPDYAETGVPAGRETSRNVRTPEEIVRMRRAGKAAAQITGSTMNSLITVSFEIKLRVALIIFSLSG